MFVHGGVISRVVDTKPVTMHAPLVYMYVTMYAALATLQYELV